MVNNNLVEEILVSARRLLDQIAVEPRLKRRHLSDATSVGNFFTVLDVAKETWIYTLTLASSYQP